MLRKEASTGCERPSNMSAAISLAKESNAPSEKSAFADFIGGIRSASANLQGLQIYIYINKYQKQQEPSTKSTMRGLYDGNID